MPGLIVLPKGNVKVKHCEACGLAFAPVRCDTKYCGSVCRQRAYRARHSWGFWNHCGYCGKEFHTFRSNKRCCSNAHKQRLYRELKALATDEDYDLQGVIMESQL